MPLINCKNELKLKRTKYCVLSAYNNKNENDNTDNIIFIIKGTKLYVPVATLSGRENQKLSKRLSKGIERSVYWNEYKQKVRIKIQQMKIDIFPNQILLALIDYLF